MVREPLHQIQAEWIRPNRFVRAEVVVAPVALHIPYVQEKLRKDFKVAAQNAWVKGSGAYTGEIRCVRIIPPSKAANNAFQHLQSSHVMSVAVGNSHWRRKRRKMALVLRDSIDNLCMQRGYSEGFWSGVGHSGAF